MRNLVTKIYTFKFKTKTFSPSFDTIDSLRMNSMLLKFIMYSSSKNISTAVSRDSFFSFSSPMLVFDGNQKKDIFIPLNFLEAYVRDCGVCGTNVKKIKGKIYLPVNVVEEIKEKIIKNSNGSFSIGEDCSVLELVKDHMEEASIKYGFRVKNEINRKTHVSENVYSTRVEILPTNTLMFVFVYTKNLSEILSRAISIIESTGISSKASIGFGSVNFIHGSEDNKLIKINPEDGVIRKGYHILLSKLLIKEDFVRNFDLKKSLYRIKKVVGTADNVRNAGFYFYEGSLIYVKNEFKVEPVFISSKNYMNINLPITYYLGDI